jgi:hypothetical protein
MKLCIGINDFDFIACSGAGIAGYLDDKKIYK